VNTSEITKKEAINGNVQFALPASQNKTKYLQKESKKKIRSIYGTAAFLYTGCTVTCVMWCDAFTAENTIRTIYQLTASKDCFRAKDKIYIEGDI